MAPTDGWVAKPERQWGCLCGTPTAIRMRDELRSRIRCLKSDRDTALFLRRTGRAFQAGCGCVIQYETDGKIATCDHLFPCDTDGKKSPTLNLGKYNNNLYYDASSWSYSTVKLETWIKIAEPHHVYTLLRVHCAQYTCKPYKSVMHTGVTINRTGPHRATPDRSRHLSSCFWCAEVFSSRVAVFFLSSWCLASTE